MDEAAGGVVAAAVVRQEWMSTRLYLCLVTSGYTQYSHDSDISNSCPRGAVE